jgi:predicted CXXCH cytochrome family protein
MSKPVAVRIIVVVVITFLLFGRFVLLERPNRSVTRAQEGRPPAPAQAWGTDHVGKPVPDYITGDECLFCHRGIGPSWQNNRHQLTMREAANSVEIAKLAKIHGASRFVADIEFVMGHTRQSRFLKRTTKYGQLDLLTAALTNGEVAPKKGNSFDEAVWDSAVFGTTCAGCHATGVDTQRHTFSALSLDCFTCHGNPTLEHTKDTTKIALSKARGDSPRVVISICGQCHIRTGKSRSTGSPFANNFVAGDNLFRDLDVNWSDREIASLNPIDAHVLQNVRDVMMTGTTVTCLSCHAVHEAGTNRHKAVADGRLCYTCHLAGRPKSVRRPYEVHSGVCRY